MNQNRDVSFLECALVILPSRKCATVFKVFLLLLVVGGWTITIHADSIIPANSPEVVKGLSALNWVIKDDCISSSGGGSSFTLAFINTHQVVLQVDTSGLAGIEASQYPVVAWAVDRSEEQSYQLKPGDKEIVLMANGLDPKIDFYLKGFSPFPDRYNGDHPKNSVKITGFRVDDRGKAISVHGPDKLWLNIGDSIMSGDAVLESAGQGRPPDSGWAKTDDARACYGYLLAQHFGYAESRLAYGGYDYHGNGGISPLPTLIDQITSTVSRLQNDKLQPTPDVIVINLGENGPPELNMVTDSLNKLRFRSNPKTKIVVMVPASGKGRAEITAAFNAYKSESHDPAVYLVDLGTIKYATADGCHPVAAGHQSIYEAALPVFEKILP